MENLAQLRQTGQVGGAGHLVLGHDQQVARLGQIFSMAAMAPARPAAASTVSGCSSLPGRGRYRGCELYPGIAHVHGAVEGGVCSIHSSRNHRSMDGVESRMRCSSSLMGPFSPVTRWGTMRCAFAGEEGMLVAFQVQCGPHPLPRTTYFSAKSGPRYRLGHGHGTLSVLMPIRRPARIQIVSKAGAGIDHHAAGVHFAQKGLGVAVMVVGDDSVGVVAAVLVDMGDGSVHAINQP